MATFKENKTIKIKPLYRLLFLGIAQLSGAFMIFRLGVLVIKEEWINVVCFLIAAGLVVWAGYLFYAFSRYYSLKNNKIVFRKGLFVFFGYELKYSDLKDVEIKTYDSELTLNIYLKQREEPIPLTATYMKIKDFHEVFKTLIEAQSQSNPEEFKPSFRR